MSYFITLEGPDGSGKTIQAARLVEHLSRRGFSALLTREPGGTPISDQIRQILGNLDNTAMDPRTEFLLFSASRAQHVQQIIAPHLKKRGVVVSDRYFDSSLAYQGFGHQLDLRMLRTVTDFATGGLTPDLTLLLDLPVEEGLRRRQKGGDWNRLDAYELAFHQRVRQGYIQLAAEDPGRWVTIDAGREADAVWETVQSTVDARLQNG